MNAFKIFLFFLFASALMPGCASNQNSVPEITYGFDSCGQCGMTIDDPRFSSVYVTASGHVHKFDDIGCMLRHVKKNKARQSIKKLFVSDFKEKTFIDGLQSTYVTGAEISTPMNYHIIAATSKEAAEALRKQYGGALVSYEKLP